MDSSLLPTPATNFPHLIPTQATKFSYIKESEEIRLAMLPLELIKRVREIEQDVYTESETAQKKDSKQTAAVDLSKRLKDTCSLNDAASLKVIREYKDTSWNKNIFVSPSQVLQSSPELQCACCAGSVTKTANGAFVIIPKC
ncbi:hypothetical protein Ahy_A04g020843 [Arachis hypogaea]|uniref:Uncharacterized protein n=1 Tax=Arachis hypogaea TaxID=3818 RepID=A0A445DIR3_ARAHY|nr:hypothetical protein Ahy_A04g020843 [Arachis hypogaea]